MENSVPKSGKGAPEKSNFSQTCNLLSQYLKERGSFGDLNLGINANLEAKGCEASRQPATTLNLLPNIENNSVASTSANIKPTDFFPQFVGFGSPNHVEDLTNKAAADFRKSSKAEPGTAQMTIFYGGQVMVFDDFPADKAKEIFALASKGSSNITKGFTSAMDKTNSTINVAPAASVSNNASPEGLQLRPQDNGSDLPIARRASLHRFFEKRKDRKASKAPYQINIPSSPARPQKSDEEKNINHWLHLEEGQSSKQIDLNL